MLSEPIPDIKVEPHEVKVQQLFFQDGDTILSAGDLLGALLTITEKYQPVAADQVPPEITAYLKEHNYITVTDNELDITNRQRQRCCELGTQVTKMMDEQLAKLPISSKVTLPQILVPVSNYSDTSRVYQALDPS